MIDREGDAATLLGWRRTQRAGLGGRSTTSRRRLGKSINRELRQRLGLTRRSCDSLMGLFIDDPEITLGVLRS
ncbi:MAG TPA: hypothetical protein VK504_18910 [Vicinamibacterales bacterium]|nr:hypothetical protein [Vicinamibacterales bacterium]